ncbi:MAG: alkaline phosphatase D family protein [Rhodothermaceae bacterium]|nr:alkaline phosphatase D family protein [Rhodothermaceae bacterium]
MPTTARSNTFLFILALVLMTSSLLPGCSSDTPSLTTAPADITRTWVGPDFWANRLQDWQVTNGRIETTEQAIGRPLRTLHLLTQRAGTEEGTLSMRVETGWLDSNSPSAEANVGFLIGAGRMLDYRAAALIHHSAGPGAGWFAGMDRAGNLFVRDLNNADSSIATMQGNSPLQESTILRLEVSRDSDGYRLNLTRETPGAPETEQTLGFGGQSSESIEGNVALVASHDRAWFKDWSVSGTRMIDHADRHAGPVLGTQYTLHEQVLKMTAQLMPIGEGDNQDVRLEINTNGQWEEAASVQVIAPGYTAPFRVEGWNDTQDIPYRVAYDLKVDGNATRTYYWEGTVRKDPVEKEVVSVAGFTGNHNTGRGVEGGNFRWIDRVWFPHTDIIDHIGTQDVDVLFFSGDQVYEGASPTFPDRENAHLDYLYKWYLWSWAFRDVTKDRPTITIPDDHDVYQGNIWGAGGPPTDKDDKGGYVMPAEWVKMIERTQTSHLPDPYDPTPIQQGIGVYYTNMNYGRVGIAIIEDRKFKSGCNGLVPGKEGRPDHFPSPDFDPSIVDLPGLTLLGDRQLTFLEDWASNWRGHDMKLVVSQTVFANMATHHGPNLMRLYGDLDSNGWPKKGRDKAVASIRKGYAFMLQGDQHLSTIVHHGVDGPNDAGYSFCVPSIANFYPRAWMPEAEGNNRPDGAPSNMGEHQDAFGNYVTVYAHTNPTALTGESTGIAPLALHDKMPGYGIARFNKTDRTITMENWPRHTKATGSQYPGWPKTIAMEDNYGRQAMGYLPTLNFSGITNPVVQVINEANQEIIYTIRINGTSFTPKVFANGTYSVRAGDQDSDNMQEFTGLAPGTEDAIEVAF